MQVGIPKEIKAQEYRVGCTPAGVAELTGAGHQVYVETGAGTGSGFSDTDYEKAGATLVDKPADLYEAACLIVKVKEPQETEYNLINKKHLLFTYFHFASSEKLTRAMLESKAVCLAYETVEMPDRSLPLLVPMSEVAGRMAVQEGAKYLEKPFGGKGVLMGGVPGVRPANVVILGAGVVGSNAAKIAAGMGAMVTILDINLNRLRYLSEIMPPNVITRMSHKYNIIDYLKTADLVIGSVLIPGGRAPKLVNKSMLQYIPKGAVIIDVAVDQGGCIETCHPTTHETPTYEVDGIIHYCVPNIPGAVPYTATLALTNATLPYILELAGKGWGKACNDNPALKAGLNIVNGEVVYKNVADAFGLKYASA